MASNYTKKCRLNLWFWRILDWICLFLPIIIYIVFTLVNEGTLIYGKVAVIGTLLIAIILTITNVMAQKKLRCPIWIVLIGLFIAIKEYLLPLIIILAITSVLDDLVFTPLINHYHTKLIASKVMDDRAKENEE